MWDIVKCERGQPKGGGNAVSSHVTKMLTKLFNNTSNSTAPTPKSSTQTPWYREHPGQSGKAGRRGDPRGRRDRGMGRGSRCAHLALPPLTRRATTRRTCGRCTVAGAPADPWGGPLDLTRGSARELRGPRRRRLARVLTRTTRGRANRVRPDTVPERARVPGPASNPACPDPCTSPGPPPRTPARARAARAALRAAARPLAALPTRGRGPPRRPFPQRAPLNRRGPTSRPARSPAATPRAPPSGKAAEALGSPLSPPRGAARAVAAAAAGRRVSAPQCAPRYFRRLTGGGNGPANRRHVRSAPRPISAAGRAPPLTPVAGARAAPGRGRSRDAAWGLAWGLEEVGCSGPTSAPSLLRSLPAVRTRRSARACLPAGRQPKGPQDNGRPQDFPGLPTTAREAGRDCGDQGTCRTCEDARVPTPLQRPTPRASRGQQSQARACPLQPPARPPRPRLPATTRPRHALSGPTAPDFATPGCRVWAAPPRLAATPLSCPGPWVSRLSSLIS